MERPEGNESFAALLRVLKERSGLSYQALARRTGVSRSTAHRYCAGSSVPVGYGVAHQLAKACGASPRELRELHTLWALADACRDERAPSGATIVSVTRASGVAGASGGRAREAADYRGADSREAGAGGAGAGRGARGRWAWAYCARGFRRCRPVQLMMLPLAVLAGLAPTLLQGMAGPFGSEAREAGGDGRLLFSARCSDAVRVGQRGPCVRETQRLLTRAGADVGTDGVFGPETLRRVTAFQVLVGTAVSGVVDTATKKALYSERVTVGSWPADRVRARIVEVFRGEPDRAVAIADCQSFLDPLHILANTDGSRNWGVFQISDHILGELGGTPRKALDPEWNIQAAKRLWSRDPEFSDWPHCDRSYGSSRSSASLIRSAGTAS